MNGAQLGVAKEPLTPKEGGLRGFFVSVRQLIQHIYELKNRC